uniref:Putative ADP-ribosylation factor GTPase-activating protein AGD14 isoform X1 n=3 Tax=Rhizophora mucronata TaxID=61149 RepID=A0A2P2M5F2_RHIMU
MASRVKEDEKNERIIRGLLKLPENRRCINCNSLGPQYVCTNFWTFVCTTCSGIHREFTHRVKSVSMSKFTSQEVAALQEGGNKHAREIYLKEWDPQHQSAPDSRNVERLRNFIKHIYVDGRYSGEKNYGKPPSAKMGEREDSYETRRTDTFQGGSRISPSGDLYEWRYNERSSPGGRSDDKNNRYGYDERRSPGYDQEGRHFNDYRRSPARAEVINDWYRGDRFGNGRKVEDRATSDGDTKLEGRSPERLKDPDAFSLPIVQPVREILGDNIVPLRISEPPKANVRTAYSTSLGSINGNPVEVKLETAGSLIDFDDPEPPVATSVPQAQQTTMPQSVASPSSTTNDNHWASFDNAPQVKVSQASSNVNPLESVLSQLSFPASVAGPTSGIPSGSGAAAATTSIGNVSALPTIGASPAAASGSTSMLLFNAHSPAVAPVNSFSTLHPNGISVATPGPATTMPVNGSNSFIRVTETWPGVQHQQPSLFPASSSQSAAQHSAQIDGASSNQPWNVLLSPNMDAGIQSVGTPQVISKSGAGLTSASASKPPAIEEKSSGRKELPEGLFTAMYSPFPVPIPVWQTGLPQGMGFTSQYSNIAAPMPTFLNQPTSANPFDISESQPAQAQTFLSMAALGSALPSVPSSGLQHASNLVTPSPTWVSSQLPYRIALPFHSPEAMAPQAMPQRLYMTQQMPSSIPLSGHQGIGGLSSEVAAFGTRSMDQQMSGRMSATAGSQSFSSVRGNPFG